MRRSQAMRGALRWLARGSCGLVLLAACFSARVGTYRGAALGWGLLVSWVCVWLWLWWRERQVLREQEVLLEVLFAPEDREGIELRQALQLNRPGAAQDGTSPALAAHYLQRTLAALDPQAILARTHRRARALRGAGLGAFAAAVLLLVWQPGRVQEGADLLVTRGARARFDLQYLHDVTLRVRPPDYLREPEHGGAASAVLAAPKGSLLTLRGRPRLQGRSLVLSDGRTEVPLLDDGQGQVTASLPILGDVELRVFARFGDSRIYDPQRIVVQAILDAAPVVELAEAPRELRLAEATESEVPIRYEARDDHGLREVQLVLRSGDRESRRNLAQLDGVTLEDRGGTRLSLQDPFVRESFLPIEVVVEAKDNDTVDGPKWGRSAAITLVPADLGEVGAREVELLRSLRSVWVTTYALSMDSAASTAHATSLRERIREDLETLTQLTEPPTSRLPRRVRTLVRKEADKVQAAAIAYARAAGAAQRERLQQATGKLTLTLDAVLRGRGQWHARKVIGQLQPLAQRLAELLPDAAPSAESAAPDQPAPLGERGAMERRLLRAAAPWMLALGPLGRDLGEIVAAYEGRVASAIAADDGFHATVAAIDLAVRLGVPEPSFQSQGMGGGGGMGGGEAGGGDGGGGGSDGEASDIERAFMEAAAELDSLLEQHSSQSAMTERAVDGESKPEDLDAFRDELRQRANELRQAARSLPESGTAPESADAAASEARRAAERMAQALESAQLPDAVEAGKQALQQLQRAREKAGAAGGWSRAEQPLQEQQKFAEQVLEQLKKKASERGQGALPGLASAEQELGERVQQLLDKTSRDEVLPTPTREALQRARRAAEQAAQALRKGQGGRGVELQRDAQQALEQAKQSLGDQSGDEEGEGGEGGEEGDGRRMGSGRTPIPGADAHKGPEAFRQRVLRGLGSGQGRNSEALQRYAEGLLR